MAKAKKPDVNKAEEIRKVLAASPEIKGVDVVEQLGKKGITVHPTQVSNVKAQLAAKSGKSAKRGPKPGSKSKKNGSMAGQVVFALTNAQAFLDAMGGDVANAKNLLDYVGKK